MSDLLHVVARENYMTCSLDVGLMAIVVPVSILIDLFDEDTERPADHSA
jgi:hypothetical protein